MIRVGGGYGFFLIKLFFDSELKCTIFSQHSNTKKIFHPVISFDSPHTILSSLICHHIYLDIPP